VRLLAGLARFISQTGLDKLGTGNLEAFIEIVDGVEDWIVVGDVFDRTIAFLKGSCP
jgi:hypothetical protein